MTAATEKRTSELDRWVIGALTAVSVALALGAAIGDEPKLFLGYLAGPATLAVLYFMFVRD